MEKTLIFSLLLFCHISMAQNTFSNCSAAFLNNKMLVEKYDKTSTCKMAKSTKGTLTVNTVALSSQSAKAVKVIPFSVAIKDKNTGTLMLFSNEIFSKINVQKVLTKCKKGDSIVLLSPSAQYALPHNEITVE